uniref:Uncharacterized protein n=1 Tax=Arundo donax TaxID=35708 RepID=A0A0A9GF55_ARUDO
MGARLVRISSYTFDAAGVRKGYILQLCSQCSTRGSCMQFLTRL